MIYLMQGATSKRVKIGYSKDPKRRLRDLQTACSEPLELIGVWEGDKAAEKELQNRFDRERCHGEWFELSYRLCQHFGIEYGKDDNNRALRDDKNKTAYMLKRIAANYPNRKRMNGTFALAIQAAEEVGHFELIALIRNYSFLVRDNDYDTKYVPTLYRWLSERRWEWSDYEHMHPWVRKTETKKVPWEVTVRW